MKSFFYTNKGPLRKNNEDGLFINGRIYTELEAWQRLEFMTNQGLFAVIDGLGGMGGGQIATKITLDDLVQESWSETPDIPKLENRLVRIPKTLLAKAYGKHELEHMGVCIAGIWFGQKEALIFNCGDCRVYQLRGSYLQKHSHDHSIVQELYDMGEIDEDSMRSHPRKNVVTSALMVEDQDPLIYIKAIKSSTNDIFLICSDGVWEALSLEDMEAIIVQEPQKVMNDFVKMAYDIPARDNYSFIIVYC